MALGGAFGIQCWGRSKRHEFYSICQSCNSAARLSSYDTFAFFALFFLPLIPLGPRRVLDQCSHCGNRKLVHPAEWRRRGTAAVAAAVAAYRASPRDEQAARSAAAVCAIYQDRAQFLSIANDILANFRENAKLTRVIGQYYCSLGHPHDGEAAFQSALRVEDKPSAYESLAQCLIQQDRPEEAAEYVRRLCDHDHSRSNFYYLLAQGFEGVGNHRRALEILDTLVSLVPAYANDKNCKRVRHIAQANLSSGKPVKSEAIRALQVPDLDRYPGATPV